MSTEIGPVKSPPDQQNSVALAFFVAAAFTVSAAFLFFARLRGYPEFTDAATGQTVFGLRRQFAPAGWVSWQLAVTIGISVGMCIVLAIKAKSLISVASECKAPIAFYLLGSFVGALIRYRLASIDVPSFAAGAAPIVAALLIGVLVTVTPKTLPLNRQLALLYLLVGAIATACAAIKGAGWPLGLCYVLIWGGLGASVALVIEVVLGGAETQ